MEEKDKIIGVCGIVCTGCDILEASEDREIAEKIASWFKKERNMDVKPEDICCLGCKGDREKHWSADCRILQCCVDEKGLELCSECEDFPCNKLVEWAKGNERYGEALDRLKGKRRQYS